MPKNVPSDEANRRWNYAYIGAVREERRRRLLWIYMDAATNRDRAEENLRDARAMLERAGIEVPVNGRIAPNEMVAFETEARDRANRVFREVDRHVDAIREKLRSFTLPPKPEEKEES